MLFPLRVIRRIHREGFRCIPEAIRFRIALHRQRPFLQTETALRQAEEDAYQAFIRRHEAPLSAPFTPTMRLSFLIPTYNTPPELLRALADSLKLLNESNPNEAVLALKSLEAFEKAADGKATKIIIPSNIQGMAGLATSLKEFFTTDTPVQ